MVEQLFHGPRRANIPQGFPSFHSWPYYPVKKRPFGMSLKMINRREDLIDRKQRAKHELTVLSDFLPMMR